MEHQLYLEGQFLNENFADVYFIINHNERIGKIPAHKVILAAGSPFLQKYFSNNIDLKKIELANTSEAALKEFLFTFYSENADKYFTIANAPSVLTLAKQFGAARCIKSAEKFLMKNLPIGQMCFGYALAIEFSLSDLKANCAKKINEKMFEVCTSQAFYHCDRKVLFEILNALTVNQLDEKKMIWDACMIWAEKRCANSGMDSSNMKKRRDLLGECFDSIMSIVSKDGEFKNYVMQHYAGLFNGDDGADDDLQDDLSTTLVCNADINQNEIVELEVVRLSEKMLATQVCWANDPALIVFQSTKKVVLNGIAFSTISGTPRGELTVGLRSDGKDFPWIKQKLPQKKYSRFEPRNYISFKNVVIEPYQDYTIKLQLIKDVVYYQCRSVSNSYSANGDFTVSFKKECGRDVFSHFFFNDFF